MIAILFMSLSGLIIILLLLENNRNCIEYKIWEITRHTTNVCFLYSCKYNLVILSDNFIFLIRK